jgi:hypothetical protein
MLVKVQVLLRNFTNTDTDGFAKKNYGRDHSHEDIQDGTNKV